MINLYFQVSQRKVLLETILLCIEKIENAQITVISSTGGTNQLQKSNRNSNNSNNIVSRRRDILAK